VFSRDVRLTEANRYSRLSSSRQLLIQPDWQQVLFILTTQKHKWTITFVTAKNKALEQNRLITQK